MYHFTETRNLENYTDMMKDLLSDSPRVAIKWNCVSCIKQLIAKPLVPIEDPLLAELKIAVLPLIRAEKVLKRFLALVSK